MTNAVADFENADFIEEIRGSLIADGIDCGRVELLRYSVNKNYKIVCSERSLFLRVYRPGKESREQIQAEHEFLDYLKKNGLGVAAPLTLTNGRSLGEFQSPLGTTYFALFDFLDGAPPADLSGFCLKWGRSLGRLHGLSRDFGGIRKKHERRLWSEASWVVNSERLLKEVTPKEKISSLLNERDGVLDYLNSLPASVNEFGVVHYDFHQGNILVANDNIQILDFDDCCRSWFVWDFALPMHRLGGHMSTRGAEQKAKFVQGYQEEIDLSSEWESSIRIFERIRHLFMVCWLAERRDEVKWKDIVPKYAKAHAAYIAAKPNLLDP